MATGKCRESKKLTTSKKEKEKSKKVENKQIDNKEKEEKKKEKAEKKKALDERDMNILCQLSQLNKSAIVVDENRRDVEEKEKELERRRLELEKQERDIQRKVTLHAAKKNKSKGNESYEINLLTSSNEYGVSDDNSEDLSIGKCDTTRPMF